MSRAQALILWGLVFMIFPPPEELTTSRLGLGGPGHCAMQKKLGAYA
jgi:hypothetical protein